MLARNEVSRTRTFVFPFDIWLFNFWIWSSRKTLTTIVPELWFVRAFVRWHLYLQLTSFVYYLIAALIFVSPLSRFPFFRDCCMFFCPIVSAEPLVHSIALLSITQCMYSFCVPPLCVYADEFSWSLLVVLSYSFRRWLYVNRKLRAKNSQWKAKAYSE